MIIVNTHEAKTQLSRLLNEVEAHHEIIRICRNGKPIADLVPVSKRVDPLKKNPKLQGVKIACNLTAALTDDEWPKELR